MNVALDTNAYSDFMRGIAERVELVRTVQSIVLPLVVLGELRAVSRPSTATPTNAANLQRFLASPRVSVLAPEEQTTHYYAQLHRQLRDGGRPIPTNDLWIAALAVQHDLVLCTSDRHFRQIPQLAIC